MGDLLAAVAVGLSLALSVGLIRLVASLEPAPDPGSNPNADTASGAAKDRR